LYDVGRSKLLSFLAFKHCNIETLITVDNACVFADKSVNMLNWISTIRLLLLVSAVDGKTFNLAVRDSDQRVLCATSEASQTMPISDLPANSMPAQVKCA